MATIIDLLADILNPNPGQNRLVAPNANGPNYLTQTGLGQEQLARFHQMSGMGGQAAPATSMPQAGPPAAIGQAPQPDQQQTAAVAPPAGRAGFMDGLRNLFGGGEEQQAIDWLQQQGMDPGTATMMAKSKPILQAYLLKRSGVTGSDAAGFSLSPGEQRYDASGNLIATGPPKGKKRDLTPEEVKARGYPAGSYQLDESSGDVTTVGGAREQDPAFGREKDLRDKYDDDENTQVYKKVRNSYERIRIGVADPSGPNDVNIIYGYMKMLDPGAAVMVNDQATAQNAGGVSENLRNIYNQVLTGESLSPEVRAQFLASADKLYAESAANLGDTNARYEGIAKGWQLDPSRIVQTPEQYEPLLPTTNTPAPQAEGLPPPPAAMAPAAPGGPAPDRFAPDIPTGPGGSIAPSADGWRPVAPGVKIRRVN